METMPDNPQTSVPKVQAVTQKNNSNTLFLVLVSIIILLLVSGGLLVLFIPSVRSRILPTNNNRQNILSSDGKTVNLPIDINDPNVILSRVIYTFKGKLLQINVTPAGTELITDINTPNLPKFIINQSTKIYYFNPKTTTPTSFTSLHNNQEIRISVYYGLKLRDWVTNSVFIMENPPNQDVISQSSASSSAQPSR